MTWGKDLLDPEAFQQQQATVAAAAQTWGPGFGLPTSTPADTTGTPADKTADAPNDPPNEQGLSIATVEQRLATDPSWWDEALSLELARQAPRKGALRAIIKTMEAEEIDAKVIAKVRTVLDKA